MRVNFETMPVDDLWRLYLEISVALAQQLTLEKSKLEERLNQLRGQVARSSETQRRPYPKVQAKFQNPDDASQSWSGRGRKPRWVTQMLTAGKSMEDFLVGRPWPDRIRGHYSVRSIGSRNLLPFQQYQFSFWVGNYSANNGPAGLNVSITDGTSNTILLSEALAPATNGPPPGRDSHSTLLRTGPPTRSASVKSTALPTLAWTM